MTAGLLTGQGMPSREGDLSIEGHGMEPIPETARYGSVNRLFTVWFSPNSTVRSSGPDRGMGAPPAPTNRRTRSRLARAAW